MKNITRFPFLAGAPTDYESIKGAHNQLADSLLDIKHRQLPKQLVDAGNLGKLEAIDFASEDANQNTARGPLTTVASNWDFPGSFPGAPLDTLLPDDQFSPGWNDLNLVGTGITGDRLVLPSKPGILTGFACVDSELRCSVSATWPTNDPYPNKDLWWQIGVFANGQLISSSTQLQAGRHSIVLPFATFVGSELTEIQVRVRIYFGQLQYEGATSRNAEPFAVYSSSVFARTTGS